MAVGTGRAVAVPRAALLACVLGPACAAAPCAAQRPTAVAQAELRADAIIAGASATEVALGVVVPAGEYLRVGGDLGAGAVVGDHRGARLGARLDGYGRFHLDPLAAARWAPYIAAGGSLRADAGARGHLYLLAAVGLEGPTAHRVVPAIEVGVGGGVRIGIALRRPARNGSAR